MSKKICPNCGAEIPGWRVTCDSCGYKEQLDDETLWKRISSYNNKAYAGMIAALVAGAAAVIGGVLWFMNMEVLGPRLLLAGIALVCLFGYMYFVNGTRMNALVNDAMGDFIQGEYRRLLGESESTGEFELNEDLVRHTGLYQDWQKYYGSKNIRIHYGNVLFEAADVSLVDFVPGDDDEDGNPTTKDETRYAGIWLYTHQTKKLEEPVYIRYDENADKHYTVSGKVPEGLWLEDLEGMLDRMGSTAEGHASMALVDDEVHIALSTKHDIFVMTDKNAAGVKDLNGLRAAITKEAEYTASIFAAASGLSTITLK